jgi:hypothetical protein
MGFVWAVPKSGKIAFGAIHATSGDIESKIGKLRVRIERTRCAGLTARPQVC